MASKTYKIRKLTSGNATGDAYGITIPSDIALNFQNVPFQIRRSGSQIILDSVIQRGKRQ